MMFTGHINTHRLSPQDSVADKIFERMTARDDSFSTIESVESENLLHI